jgi:hypothetical protein
MYSAAAAESRMPDLVKSFQLPVDERPVEAKYSWTRRFSSVEKAGFCREKVIVDMEMQKRENGLQGAADVFTMVVRGRGG